MAYAHARGVIHRDLKPQNVMVGSFGEVQVMDWGLAKVMRTASLIDERTPEPERETTVTTARSVSETYASSAGSVMGTPAYMPPEQASGDVAALDERSDVFALGAILCEILTGRPPYSGRTLAEIHRKAALGDLKETLDRLASCDADADLLELARRCLAREAKDRHRDAGEVAAAMTAYLAGVQERLRTTELARARPRPGARRSANDGKLSCEWRRRLSWRSQPGQPVSRSSGIGPRTTFAPPMPGSDWLERRSSGFTRGRAKTCCSKSRSSKSCARSFSALRSSSTRSCKPHSKRNRAMRRVPSSRRRTRASGRSRERSADFRPRSTLISGRVRSANGWRTRFPAQSSRNPRSQTSSRDQAEYLSDVGRLDEALDAVVQARTIRQSIYDREPDVVSTRMKLAENLIQVGHLVGARRGRVQDGMEAIEQAISIHEELAHESRANPAVLRGMGDAQFAKAELLHQMGRGAESIEPINAAVTAFEQVARLAPDDLKIRERLGRALMNSGTVATDLNKGDDAERSFRRALTNYESLVRDRPNDKRFLFDLGLAHHSLGWWLGAVEPRCRWT